MPPLGEDGRVVSVNILVASILLLASIFSVVRITLKALTKLNSKVSGYVSAVVSITTVQLLLVSSLKLLTPIIFAVVMVFNLLSFWYLHKRFKAN